MPCCAIALSTDAGVATRKSRHTNAPARGHPRGHVHCIGMHSHLAPRDLGLILAVVALWGFSFVPIKWGLESLPPFMLAALRFLLAAIPAIFLVAPPKMPWRAVVLYGLAIGVGQFGLLFLGMKLGMPAGLSSLVAQLQVFFTIALTVAFAGDRLHRWNVAGGTVALAGVVLLGVYQLSVGEEAPLLGFLLVVACGAAWGAGNLIAKQSQGADMFAMVVWSSLVPPPILALVSWFSEGGNDVFRAVLVAPWKAWASVLFMAWVGTLFGFSTWSRLLQRYPAPLVSPFALLVPVSGLICGAIFLGEHLAVVQLAGVAVVFAGLAINVYGPRLRRGIG